MKAVSLEAFREPAKSRAVPPQDFDPIGGLDPEHEQGAVERIGASVTHERRQPIGPFAEVDRLRRQNNARIGWNHLRGKTVCPLLRLRWLALRCASEGCSVVRADPQRRRASHGAVYRNFRWD